jgi:hypothetical protein
MLPQRFPVGSRDFGRRLKLLRRHVRSEAFAYTQRMHTVEQVATRQAVAAAAETFNLELPVTIKRTRSP